MHFGRRKSKKPTEPTATFTSRAAGKLTKNHSPMRDEYDNSDDTNRTETLVVYTIDPEASRARWHQAMRAVRSAQLDAKTVSEISHLSNPLATLREILRRRAIDSQNGTTSAESRSIQELVDLAATQAMGSSLLSNVGGLDTTNTLRRIADCVQSTAEIRYAMESLTDWCKGSSWNEAVPKPGFIDIVFKHPEDRSMQGKSGVWSSARSLFTSTANTREDPLLLAGDDAAGVVESKLTSLAQSSQSSWAETLGSLAWKYVINPPLAILSTIKNIARSKIARDCPGLPIIPGNHLLQNDGSVVSQIETCWRGGTPEEWNWDLPSTKVDIGLLTSLDESLASISMDVDTRARAADLKKREDTNAGRSDYNSRWYDWLTRRQDELNEAIIRQQQQSTQSFWQRCWQSIFTPRPTTFQQTTNGKPIPSILQPGVRE